MIETESREPGFFWTRKQILAYHSRYDSLLLQRERLNGSWQIPSRQIHERNRCDSSALVRQAKKPIQALAIQLSCLEAEREQERMDMLFLNHIPPGELRQRCRQPSNEPRKDIQIAEECSKRKGTFGVQPDLPFSES